MNIRNLKLNYLLWYLAGSAAALGCWTAARAITQLWTGTAAGVQVFLPVLVSPLISLPLGLFGAMTGYAAEKIQQRDFSASARFITGSLPVIILLVIDFAVRASAAMH